MLPEIQNNTPVGVNGHPSVDELAGDNSTLARAKSHIADVKARAAPYTEAILEKLSAEYGLEGVIDGDEFKMRNVRRPGDKSAGAFKYSLGKDVWSDFGGGKDAQGKPLISGSDIISVVSYVMDSKPGVAARWVDAAINDFVTNGIPRSHLKKTSASTPNYTEMPAPDDVEASSNITDKLHWAYHNADGLRVGYVTRFDTIGSDGKPAKKYSQWCYGLFDGETTPRWINKSVKAPRPLYRLPAIIAAGKDAWVIVAEGEKSAEAAQILFDTFGTRKVVATTSMGGSNNASQTDWSVIAGCKVIICPDEGTAGSNYIRDVTRILHGLGCPLWVVNMDELSRIDPNGGEREPPKSGWDVCDAMGYGHTAKGPWGDQKAFYVALKARISRWWPPETDEGEEEPQVSKPTNAPQAQPKRTLGSLKRNLAVIVDQCPWLGHVQSSHGADLTDDLKDAALDIAATCTSTAGAQKLFSSSANYDAATVEESLRARAALDKPLTTCQKIMELGAAQCAACKHKSHRFKGNNPTNLPEVVSVAKSDADRAKAVPIDQAIKGLNEQFFAVILGNKTRVGSWQTTEDGGYELAAMSWNDFKIFHENRTTTILTPDGEASAARGVEWWWRNQNRASYSGGVGLDPNSPARGRMKGDRLNLWSGWGCTPAKGEWPLIEKHIRHVICGDVDAYSEYVLNWIAKLYQCAGDPIQVALCVRGLKGTGKGTLFNAIVRTFGSHGVIVADPRHIVGNFNSHLLNKLLMFIDEGFWAGDKKAEGVLKRMITDDRIMFEPKGVDSFMDVNRLSFLMATNSEWVAPVSADERRFAIFDCLSTYAAKINGEYNKLHKPYFDSLRGEIAGNGMNAMMHAMMDRKIGEFNILDVPQTSALRSQATLSLRINDRWWFDVLNAGELPRTDDQLQRGYCPVSSDMALSEAISESLRAAQTRGHSIGEDVRIWAYLKDFVGASARKDVTGSRRAWLFPSLPIARANWEKKFGPTTWDVDATDWHDYQSKKTP